MDQSVKQLGLEEAIGFVGKEIAEIKFRGEPQELYDPINYILQLGGKRLRPVLLILACDLFKGDVANAMHAAKGVEVFHNFSLVHDDIMDNANLRRGKQTVHEKWDANIAILSGDAMLMKAYTFLLEGEYNDLKAVLNEFNRVAIEVCEGQQLDMNYETEESVTIDEYINMIRLKTSVLLGVSLKIGAMVGGASEKDAELLYQFGVNAGIGFQLMDDYLDAFGDPEKFGKKVGGDIISNKKTFLFITALDKDSTGEMERWMSRSEFDEQEKVEAVKALYRSTGTDVLCKDEMNRYYDKALESLNEVGVEDERKTALKGFLEYIRNRAL